MSIVLALPSKGRLRDQTLEAMAGAGFAVREAADQRNYRATVDGEARYSALCAAQSLLAEKEASSCALCGDGKPEGGCKRPMIRMTPRRAKRGATA